MSAEPGLASSNATAQIVRKLRSNFFGDSQRRHGDFARAHALRYRTGRFWLNGMGVIMFTARDAGPDIELTEATTAYGNETYKIAFARLLTSMSLPVPAETMNAAHFLDTLIKLGTELETTARSRKVSLQRRHHHLLHGH